jgi:hypothetical protein
MEKIIKDFGICFSGQPRCVEKGYEDFLNLFNGLEYDVFGHIWQHDKLLSSWGDQMGWENKQSKVHDATQFVELYKPKKYIIEDYDKTDFYKNTSVSPGYRNPINKVWSSWSQFYSIKKAFEVKEQYENENNVSYKYAIKYRMDHDVEWDKTIVDWENIKKRIDENPKLILVNPGYDWPDGHGCSNLFAIGTSEAMKKYSLVYDNYPEIIKTNQYASYDESNLKVHLEKINDLVVEHCSIHIGVYR